MNSCIADALSFGDLDDPKSNVSRLVRDQPHFRMHQELGTEPGFYYLYDKHTMRPPAAPGSEADPTAEPGSVRSKGVEPWHQEHWDWKAAANFLCGGAGAGLFACAAAVGIAGAPFVALGLLALALVALGLCMLFFKIGRPLRFLYVLRQPQRSWMSREAWIAAVFFPFALLSLWMESVHMAIGAAVVGLLFLYAQAMIVKEAKGIPAWRSPRVIPLLVVTGLAEGTGLFAVSVAILPAIGPFAIEAAATLAALTALRGFAWHHYLGDLDAQGAPVRTREVLGRFRRLFFTAGVAAPLALVGLGFVMQDAMRPLAAVAGLAVFAAGWALKFNLITRAGYNQGFAIRRVQADRSPGPAIKPGWAAPRGQPAAGAQ